MQKTYEINGKEYPIKDFVKTSAGNIVPLVELPMMSDRRWHEICLNDRLEHPEKYPDEDLPQVIEKLRRALI